MVDRVVFDGAIPEGWPNAETFVASDVAQIGWSYANGVFSPPPPPLPPIPPTAAELDAMDTATLNTLLLQPGSVDRAELKTLFNHENRIRALEGKAAITQNQFVTALKAVIR